MIDLPEDLLTEPLDPAIHAESKDRYPWSEEERQAQFVAECRRLHRALRVVAVPNGAKRSRWEAAKETRLGLLSGEPDLGVSWADAPTARIEFKNGRAMPTPNQIAALNWYHRRGHPVAVCRTAAGATAWLRSIGAPIGG